MMDSMGRNPVLSPEICIPDGEARVFGDRLYVYGSRDRYPDTYCSEEYTVVSTGDMLHWTVHDVSLDGRRIPWVLNKPKKGYPIVDFDIRSPAPAFRNLLTALKLPVDSIPTLLRPAAVTTNQIPVSRKGMLYAPDCIEKNGKYYLYFCLSDNTEGVAVSDSPEGPFENPVQLPCGGIDPAVFTDDDGRSYYYWGQFRACAVPLNEDMVSFDADRTVSHIVTEEQHGFHEGSSMRKRNGIYYYVYPCVYREGRPTCLAYATSDSPLGPFTYRGIIIDNAKCDPASWNIHGSIQCFRGQWYVFYHRSSRNSEFGRRLCVEKIEFAEDGTIPEVRMTSIGAGKPFALGEEIPGWRACEVDGGAYISGENLILPDGGSAVFRYVHWDRTPAEIRADVSGSGKWELLADGMPIGEAGTGTHEIRFVSRGGGMLRSITFL